MNKMKWWSRLLPGVLLIVAFLVIAMPWEASADSSGEIREQIDALEAQREELSKKTEELEAQLQENLTQMEDIVRRKGQIDQQITLLHEQIDNTNEQISAYAVLIADKQEELEEAESELAALNEKHKARIRAMEEQNELSYWSILFQANSFSDLLDRMSMIEEIAASDSRRLQELREAAERVELASRSLETEKESLEQTRASLQESQQTLDEKRTEADELLQTLLSKGEAYEQLLEESEQKQDALMQQIAQMENEYDQKAYEEWLATSVPETTVPETTVPEEETSGQEEQPSESGGTEWLDPVPYYTLTSPFGMRFHPILNIWRMHNGVDLACAMDTPIYASRSGVISYTGFEEDGAGIYVQISHGDGYRSIYMHMTRHVVTMGQSVAAGEIIGYVGSTGLSDGPHLHFGISYNGTYVNPMEYLP